MNMIDAVCNCHSAVTVLDQSLHCNQQTLFLIIINVLHIICCVCPHQSDLPPLYDGCVRVPTCRRVWAEAGSWVRGELGTL